MARRGLHPNVDKDDSEDSDEVGEQEESVTGIVDEPGANGYRVELVSVNAGDVHLSGGQMTDYSRVNWANGKETSIPFKFFTDSLPRVNNHGSDCE
ncbi:hypothetical protein Tco_0506368 [Tanacetum coccineum]